MPLVLDMEWMPVSLRRRRSQSRDKVTEGRRLGSMVRYSPALRDWPVSNTFVSVVAAAAARRTATAARMRGMLLKGVAMAS